MMVIPNPERAFEFTGGRLCLDFANTVYRRPTAAPRDYMADYRRLIAWARQAQLLDARHAADLLRAAAARPAVAAGLFPRAVALREAIYRIFSRLASQQAPRPRDLAILNRELQGALRRPQIVKRGRGFIWNWDGDESGESLILFPVVRSGAELLTSSDLPALRECAADNCGWLFLDGSRNGSRRWCDMKTCGNRAKVRRYHARRRPRG